MNELIETLFKDFTVNGIAIPVSFLYYEGHGEPYVTYQQISAEEKLSGDDDLVGYADYYDFDIYSKGNYMPIVESIKQLLKQNNFVWQPSRTSRDMYEPDTGYYHKTINFAILRED